MDYFTTNTFCVGYFLYTILVLNTPTLCQNTTKKSATGFFFFSFILSIKKEAYSQKQTGEYSINLPNLYSVARATPCFFLSRRHNPRSPPPPRGWVGLGWDGLSLTSKCLQRCWKQGDCQWHPKFSCHKANYFFGKCKIHIYPSQILLIKFTLFTAFLIQKMSQQLKN